MLKSVTITLIAALASLAGSEWVPKTDAKPERPKVDAGFASESTTKQTIWRLSGSI